MKFDEQKISVSEHDRSWVSYEIERCLNCYDPPCQASCPAGIPIPSFISSLKTGNINRAVKIIYQANPVASICGKVCPEEIFCQSNCTRSKIDSPVKIRELHGYATDAVKDSRLKENKKKGSVAIIGSGPAGISCATVLSENGMKTTIYEKSNTPGGVPSSSIPDFRLGDDTISLDIERAENTGIKIITNKLIDNPLELLEEYKAIFIATGLSINKKAKLPGGDLPAVLPALSFLENARTEGVSYVRDKDIVIVGGGNVSLDVAATALESGASSVRLLYRRGPQQMKVWRSELEEAQLRGAIIDYLVSPIEYLSESNVLKAVRCIRMKLSNDLDTSDRRVPVPVDGSEFIIPADFIIEAIGMESDFCKEITVNRDQTTSIEGIFAGGDWARGEGTIVEAVRDGKQAAHKIMAYLKEKSI